MTAEPLPRYEFVELVCAPRSETDTLITGLATWYCGGGSSCTHGHS